MRGSDTDSYTVKPASLVLIPFTDIIDFKGATLLHSEEYYLIANLLRRMVGDGVVNMFISCPPSVEVSNLSCN